MKFQMIYVENDKVIMRDPRVFNSFETAEYALSKRIVCDQIAGNEGYNWSIAVV